MALLTKNSTASQAVLWTGCLLSGAGLYLDPSDTLFATGLALVCFGMIQAYYGAVVEIEHPKRLPYIALGIPLALGLVYLAFLGLRQYLSRLRFFCVLGAATFVAVLVRHSGRGIASLGPAIAARVFALVCLAASVMITLTATYWYRPSLLMLVVQLPAAYILLFVD